MIGDQQMFRVWIVVLLVAWIAAGILLRNPFLVLLFGFYLLTAMCGVGNNDRPEGA